MTIMKHALTLLLLLTCASARGQTPLPPPTPEPPMAVDGVIVLGPTLTPPIPDPAATPIICQAGRFVPITPADGSPSYIAPSAGYRVYKLTPGSSFTGV